MGRLGAGSGDLGAVCTAPDRIYTGRGCEKKRRAHQRTSILLHQHSQSLANDLLGRRGMDDCRAKTGYRYVDLPHEYALGNQKLGIKLDRTGHTDIHIWHEDNASQMSSWVFISNELADAMSAADITDLKYEHIEEDKCLPNLAMPSPGG